jgi:hypothetical protein
MSDSYAGYIAKYPIKWKNSYLFFLTKNQIFIYRKQRRREHPTTPNKYRKCSRRCFDGQLRTWRRNLHQFDENTKEDPTGANEIIDINENVELILTEYYDKNFFFSWTVPFFFIFALFLYTYTKSDTNFFFFYLLFMYSLLAHVCHLTL